MRRDLENRNLQRFYPMYPYELSSVATIWYGAQLFKAGYLEMSYGSALFHNSPQYLHTSFFKRNSDFFCDVWDWSCQHDQLDMGQYFVDMKYTLEDGKVMDGANDVRDFEELNSSVAKMYLATVRMTMALGQHYADLFSVNGTFTTEAHQRMITQGKFDVVKENPFIELVKTLAGNFRSRALLFAFLTTCPVGHAKVLIDTPEANESFDLMSPFSNLSNLYDSNTLQNYISIVDWMNV